MQTHLGDVALSGNSGGVDDLDVESTSVSCHAASRCGGGRGEESGDSLGSGGGSANESEKTKSVLHFEGEEVVKKS